MASHADFYETLSGFANAMTDSELDTYAKNVASTAAGVQPSEFQSFSFESEVTHRKANITEVDGGPVHHCSTVVAPDKTEYRMAIKIESDTYDHIMEGELFYLAMCAPHTPQGKIELETLWLMEQTGEMYRFLEREFQKQLEQQNTGNQEKEISI